jgi:hypothetical protein
VAILAMSLLYGCADGDVPWGRDAPGTGTSPDARPSDPSRSDAPDDPEDQPAVFRCPALSAVAGLDAEGKPSCAPTGPDGLVPAWDTYGCPERYTRQMLHFEAASENSVNLYACFLDRSVSEGDDPGYRHPTLGGFSCPLGTVLRGFGADGSALCRADGSVPLGYALSPYWDGDWTANTFTCVHGYERSSLHYDCGCSDNATWPTCMRTADADFDFAAGDAGASAALGWTCPGAEVVIGFAADGSQVCGTPALGIPIGFGFYPQWTAAVGFSCPEMEERNTLHYDCDCTDDGTWYGCYVR